jgi:hypothetical protein
MELISQARWWRHADAIKADKILYTNDTPVKTDYTLKIVGVQDLYDGYSIYMSQNNANKILGLQNPEQTLTFANGDKANIWSNAKLSKDDFINDQMRRMILHADGGDNSIYGMGKGTIAPSINKANYVASTKSVINKLVVSVYAICMIFVVISIITALIVIYLITDLSKILRAWSRNWKTNSTWFTIKFISKRRNFKFILTNCGAHCA